MRRGCTRADGGEAVTRVEDIPVAHTPPGGYGAEMPPPVLAGCDETLVADAPDLRGTWHVVDAHAGTGTLPDDHPIRTHVERIEQAGNRVVVTSDGIVHDMVCDGTFEHGVNDVMALDFTTPIVVAATFEDGVLVLRPAGGPVSKFAASGTVNTSCGSTTPRSPPRSRAPRRRCVWSRRTIVMHCAMIPSPSESEKT